MTATGVHFLARDNDNLIHEVYIAKQLLISTFAVEYSMTAIENLLPFHCTLCLQGSRVTSIQLPEPPDGKHALLSTGDCLCSNPIVSLTSHT